MAKGNKIRINVVDPQTGDRRIAIKEKGVKEVKTSDKKKFIPKPGTVIIPK